MSIWESADKPGSVEDNHSSRIYVTINLISDLPRSHTGHVLENTPCPSIWSCFRWGLPSHSCYQLRGVLLPHRFTLT